jgi:glycerol uptake facilitator-like aquaporin
MRWSASAAKAKARQTVAEARLARRLGAEALGSFLLFACVIGSGVMGEQLAGGNVAVALLANALATAAMLFVLIAMLGPISGAHFNPAVTLAFALRGELPWRDVAPYTLVQLAGGIPGALVVHAMFALPILQTSTHTRTGPAQWLSEAVATCGLVLVILLTRHHRAAVVPASVALYIGAAYWFTASTSFANPVITVVRSLSDTFAGIAPVDVPAFIVAQLAGMVLALLIARGLLD